MSRSTVHVQLALKDGVGNHLPISTGTWITQAINVEEQRRLSITVGVASATGAPGDFGGFTGILLVQGTNELAKSYGATGTPQVGAGRQPGVNGFTGAMFWSTLTSVNVDNTIGSGLSATGGPILINFDKICVPWVRLVFNQGITNPIGSGTMEVFLTGKNT